MATRYLTRQELEQAIQTHYRDAEQLYKRSHYTDWVERTEADTAELIDNLADMQETILNMMLGMVRLMPSVVNNSRVEVYTAKNKESEYSKDGDEG